MQKLKNITQISILFLILFQNSFAQKVISLAPNITEIICALGAEDNLIGISKYCNYPEKFMELPKVGDMVNLDIERILSLKPEIAFVPISIMENQLQFLEENNITHITIHPLTIAELYDAINKIGKSFDKISVADSMIANIKTKIDYIKMDSVNSNPKIYIEISSNPLISCSAKSFMGELIEIAGGENLFENDKEFLKVSQESIIILNPDIILLSEHSGTNPEILRKRLGWENINAIKNNRIYFDFDEDILFRPSPRIIQGLEYLHKLIKESK